MLQRYLIIILMILSLLSLSGCSGDTESTPVDETNPVSISGIAQKGPFKAGSVVVIYKLNADYERSSQSVTGTISDDFGHYNMDVPWSGLSEVEVDGLYFDEVSGEVSDTSIKLSSILYIDGRVSVGGNVNLFTTLASAKIRTLLKEGQDLVVAKNIALSDLEALFSLVDTEGLDIGSLDLSVFEGNMATVNMALLQLSAAFMDSEDPLADLEALILIYNTEGLEGLLASDIFAKIQRARYRVDVPAVVANLEKLDSTIVIDDIDFTQLVLLPHANAYRTNNIMGSLTQGVKVDLFGATFNDRDLDEFTFISAPAGAVNIERYTVSEDNQSVVFDINFSSCIERIDMSVSFSESELNITTPLDSNTFNLYTAMTICNSETGGGSIIVVPTPSAPSLDLNVHYDGVVQGLPQALRLDLKNTKLLDADLLNYTVLSSDDSALNIENISVGDDLQSIILDVNYSSCVMGVDLNISINANELNTSTTLLSNTLHIDTSMVICNPDDGGGEIVVPINKTPFAVIGMDMNNVETQNITAYVGARVNGLESSYSYDQDAYPLGGIIHCEWRDENNLLLIESDDTMCDLYEHVFDTAGVYDYNLTVTDTSGAKDSNIAHITVLANSIPEVSLTPSSEQTVIIGTTLDINVSASDADAGDTLTYSWSVHKIGSNSQMYGGNAILFRDEFNELGRFEVKVVVSDSHYAQTSASVIVNVEALPMTFNDININIYPKEDDHFSTGIGTSENDVTLYSQATHGDVEILLMGNEIWDIIYTSTDCFIGEDSFIYENGGEYGLVKVTIENPSTLSAPTESRVLYSAEIIEGEYLRADSASIDVSIDTETAYGSVSLTTIEHEIVNYNYDPDDDYAGFDYFTYTLTETINECAYSALGRMNFDVQLYVPESKLITMCQDPYSIGMELYKTEGSLETTSLIKDILPGYTSDKAVSSGFVTMKDMFKVGDVQYFSSNHSAGGATGYELYESNGSTEGTLVHDINEHNEFTSTYLYGSSHPSLKIKVDNQVYFTASDNNYSRYGLYRADGTSITRIADTTGLRYSNINGRVYDMSERAHVMYLERVGSDMNSLEILESFDGYDFGNTVDFGTHLEVLDDTLIFSMRDESNTYEGLQLWAKKGDANATRLSTEYMIHDYGQDLIKIGDKVYMIADELGLGTGKRILETNGTVEGTKISYVLDSGSINSLMSINDKLYFRLKFIDADTWDTNYELWSYDPVTETASLVKEILIDADGDSLNSTMGSMRIFEDKILFETMMYVLDDSEPDYEQLWVSDGTPEGTLPILKRNYRATDLREPFKLNDMYYFQDTMGVLYKTDFTLEGTSIEIPYLCGITPNNLDFVGVDGVELSTYQEENITIDGLTYDETRISITNGEYSLDNKQTWLTGPSTVSNGTNIYVRHISSSAYDSDVYTELSVGGRSDSFRSTTKTETLSTPNQFTFTDVSNANVSTIVEDSITVSGINIAVDLSIVGGEYSLDSGSTWSSLDTTVENDQVVKVRHTTSASNEVSVETTLTVSTVSDTFTSTTRVASVGGDTVTVGALMWEDTEHTRLATLTWSAASTYCADLVLESHDDWRLPYSEMDSGGEINELRTIRVGALNTDGETYTGYGEVVDENSLTIIEGFTPVYHSDWVTSWTSEAIGESAHAVMIFQYSIENGDGFFNDDEVGVRCVRDIE